MRRRPLAENNEETPPWNRPYETCLCRRLADRAFALAADPRLLAEAPRYRRRLCAKLPVEADEAAAFFRDLAGHGFVGCNVTVPHKEAAFRAAACPDAAARSVGAANTLWLEDGVLCASNTDIYGFLTNLDEQRAGLG